MTKRILPSMATMAVVVLVAAPSFPVEGQTVIPTIGGAVPKGWTPPRTPWGDPDLQDN